MLSRMVNSEYALQDQFLTRFFSKIDIVKDVPMHFGTFYMKDFVRVDSLENIGSNKVLAVFGRKDG